MRDFPNNLPNWLRYILAVPCGIICTLFTTFIVQLSLNLYSEPDSLYYIFVSFVFANFASVIVFFYGMNIMLPKYQFVITLAISIVAGILFSIFLGIYIAYYRTFTVDIIGYIIYMIALVVSCVYSYKNKMNEIDKQLGDE